MRASDLVLAGAALALLAPVCRLVAGLLGHSLEGLTAVGLRFLAPRESDVSLKPSKGAGRGNREGRWGGGRGGGL